MLNNYTHKQTKAAQEPPTPAAPRHTTPSSTTQKAQWQGGTNPIYKALGRQVAGHLTLHTQPINPDLDIELTGKCTIQYGLNNPCQWHTDLQMQVAHVYNAQGKHVGTINADRLLLLHRNFQHIASKNKKGERLSASVKETAWPSPCRHPLPPGSGPR